MWKPSMRHSTLSRPPFYSKKIYLLKKMVYTKRSTHTNPGYPANRVSNLPRNLLALVLMVAVVTLHIVVLTTGCNLFYSLLNSYFTLTVKNERMKTQRFFNYLKVKVEDFFSQNFSSLNSWRNGAANWIKQIFADSSLKMSEVEPCQFFQVFPQ